LSEQLSLQKEIVKWLYEDVKVHIEQSKRVSNLTDVELTTQQTKEQTQLTLNASQQHLLNAKAQVVSYGRQ
jgi:ribosome-binding ATPase YchF (GTP1/OBG family)